MQDTAKLQQQARLIIEAAMAELKSIGADHDEAAALLAIQGAVRIQNDAKLATVADFINGMVEGNNSSEGETIQ